MKTLVWLSFSALLVAACSFEPPPDVGDDAGDDDDTGDGGGIDASVDAPSAPAMLTTDAEPHPFGDVTVGQMSAFFQVVVQNTGDLESGAVALSLTGSGAGQFEIVPTGDATDCAGRLLTAAETCIAQVRFHPVAAGAAAATLVAEATPGGSVTVDLTGNGLTAGNLEITAGATLDFGTYEIDTMSTTQSIDVRNTGGTATATLTVQLGDAVNYTKLNDTCGGAPLGAGQTCSVSLRFNPTSVGALPTQLSVRESASVGVSAAATGTGSARVQLSRSGNGTISSEPSGILCATGSASQTSSFTQTPITLTATPDLGWTFDHWTGPCSDSSLTCSVPLSAPLNTVSATFRQLDCVPDSIVCDDSTDHYVDCDGAGNVEFEMQCPLGCASGAEKCVDVEPSNGLTAYLDQAHTDPNSIAVSFTAASSTINTDTGAVFNGSTSLSIPSAVVTQAPGNPSIRVFMMKSLTLGGTVKVTGSRPLAVVVDGDVTITGTLDVSADGGVGGPGVYSSGCNNTCDSGGGSVSGGGGGAGNKNVGAEGGASGTGVAGGGGGSSHGEDDLEPIHGGTQSGLASEGSPLCWTDRAAGGGAVQLVSRTRIAITSSGKIDASGGGGRGAVAGLNNCTSSSIVGGGGGGSGGAILLEAPQVILDGAGVVLSTKGGSGAAGGLAVHGSDGGTAAGATVGAQSSTYGDGGNGGTESLLPTAGGAGTSTSQHGGGGGGSVGRARFNTTAGAINPQNGAAVRSASSNGTLRTRLVP